MTSTLSRTQERSDDAGMARGELGRFLRARREGLQPAQIGLSVAGRRRTPGLRREELAVLAGISVTWYTSLEQGRDVRASGQVLDALARALQLTEPERAHLIGLGSLEPVSETDPAVPAALLAMLAALEPLPAYVTGPLLNILACNDTAREGFGGRTPPFNLARWVFTDPVAREVLVDWEQVAADVLARLRGKAGRHRGDPYFEALVAQVRAASPEADAWWPRYDVAVPRAGTKRLRLPRVGEVTRTHTAFTVADHPGLTLAVYTLLPSAA